MSQNDGVAIRYVRALLSTNIGREHYGSLLRNAQIDPQSLKDPAGRVSVEQYAQLLQAIWRIVPDESFGFTTHIMKPGTFTLMCQTLLTCDHLEHALRRVARFYGLVTDDFQLAIKVHGAGARFELHINRSLLGSESFFTEAIFALFLRLGAWLIDQSIQPLQICFRYPANEGAYSFEGKLSCPVGYEKSCSFLDFPKRSLAESIKRNGSELKALLAKGPQHFLVDFKEQDRYSDRLKAYWNQKADLLNTSLETFAENFGLSPSSLRRKLREEGSNFHDLRESVRKQRSLYYLSHTHKNLESIAALMGYSEPSTFHRAFKKWTGMTPRAFRQKRQNATEAEMH